jgi:hypothetical protein
MSYRRMFEQREMLRWIEVRDRARRRGDDLPSLEEFRATRPLSSAARWREWRHDLFWYFRSYCLLAASEGNRIAAAGYALGAALLAPGNALRLLGRWVVDGGSSAS